MTRNELARFTCKVLRRRNGCLEWIAGKRQGYGVMRIRVADKWIVASAHRLAYEHYIGPIPQHRQIDHLCRNRACVNPKHMELVTLSENLRRGLGLAAVNRRKLYCLNGHPFSGKNLIVLKNGNRQCRACRSAYDRKRRPVTCKPGKYERTAAILSKQSAAAQRRLAEGRNLLCRP
jgi:hypothetical protein